MEFKEAATNYSFKEIGEYFSALSNEAILRDKEEHRGVKVPMFAVITRESVAPVSDIHDRMPLILGKESLRDWIRPYGDPIRIVKKALTDMVMEKAGDYPDPKPAFMQI